MSFDRTADPVLIHQKAEEISKIYMDLAGKMKHKNQVGIMYLKMEG